MTSLAALIFVASTCAGTNVEECYVIPHPTNANKFILEVCEKRSAPHVYEYTTDTTPKITIKAIHKPVTACSSHNRPKDWMHWIQVP